MPLDFSHALTLSISCMIRSFRYGDSCMVLHNLIPPPVIIYLFVSIFMAYNRMKEGEIGPYDFIGTCSNTVLYFPSKYLK